MENQEQKQGQAHAQGHRQEQKQQHGQERDPAKGSLERTTVRYFLKLLRTTGIPKLVLGAAALLSVIASLTGLVVPLMTGGLIDSFKAETLQGKTIALLAAVFILQAVASGVSYYMLAYTGTKTVNKLRKRLWNKVLTLPVSFFDQNRSTDTMSRITNDTNEIKSLITDHLIAFCTNLLTVVGAVAILFYLDWQMTLIILLAIAVGFGIMMPIGGKMYKISLGTQRQLANLATLLSQVIGEIRLVKASNAERREQEGGFERMDSLYRFGMKEAKVNAVLFPLMSTVMIALLVVIIGYGGVRVASGALSAGELVSFILLLFQIMLPFSQFATFYSQLQKVMGATERLRLLLEHEPESGADGLAVPVGQRDIVFRDVAFAYQQGEPVLRGVSFTIPANRVTALVGPSGSGKTTIFSLLERFYTPDSGTISFGEEPVSRYSLSSWRKKFGYVSQESSLMSGTIRDNLVYGRDDEVTDAELTEAARLAYAQTFIEALPRRYEMEVGERGIQLSGGQRQRIAIARALLRNPDLLLLDEATASLDSDSEHEVQKALQHLMQERTTVVIAHRLSTVVQADQILVLENGRITGSGTHEELLYEHSSYTEWARKQFQLGE
ncbi:multidrug ABC transporter permease [Paenibacillus sp. J31TS4]|uniref:ABC transporter ATP-binding protein n=1 Tax=Paenibacillus sp. J31TS4 TaxID=2807195 RepID=UPI001B0B91BF|nr:ABC transporter ATP-binding protein [Paenibacillus sp. J31TS4]GIP38144.1 multidrug ABC transporter permease [Paenibacillus sp. J31TS4]